MLVDEVAQASDDIRSYIAAEVVEHPPFAGGLFGALRPDLANRARAGSVVLPRLRALVA